MAVQENVEPGIVEDNRMLVDSPEQIDEESGLFVTTGGMVSDNCIVSLPVHPSVVVTAIA